MSQATAPTSSQLPSEADPEPNTRLRGRMGAPSVVFMVLACMSPLTGAAGYAALVVVGGDGLGAPFMFALVGLAVLIFAVGYVGIVKRVARPGAFYAYVTAGLGKRIGLGGAFLTLITYFLSEIGLITFGGISLSAIIATTFQGPALEWWVCAIPFLVIATILAYFNVAVSAKLLGVILVIELVLVISFDVVIAVTGGPEGVSTNSFTTDALFSGSLPLAFLFCLTLFSGWESTALYYEEIRNPRRTIARATYTIVGVVAVLYVITTWMLITSYGSSQAVAVMGADYSSAFLNAVTSHMGVIVRDIVNVFLVTGIMASVLSMNNMLSRYVYSLSVDRVFPAYFGKASVRHGSPARASALVTIVLVIAIVVILLCGLDANGILALTSGSGTYGFLIMFLLATIAILVFFVRKPDKSLAHQIAVIASALVSGVIFAVMLVYVAGNLDLIVGDQPALTISLQVILYASFGIGVGYASYLAIHRRRTFDRIGRQEIAPDDGQPM